MLQRGFPCTHAAGLGVDQCHLRDVRAILIDLFKSLILWHGSSIESAGGNPSTLDVQHDQVGQKAQQDSLKVFVVGVN
jgi:hypothetical protein